MLAQPRRVATIPRRGLRPLRGHGHGADAPLGRVVVLGEVADRLEVRVGNDVLEFVHALGGDVGALEGLEPLCSSALRDLAGQHAVRVRIVSAARGRGGKPRVLVHHARLSYQLEERAPLLVVVDQDADVAVRRRKGPALLGEDARVARLPHPRLKSRPAQVLAHYHHQHVLEHRDVDTLPLAGLFPVIERGAHRARDLLADRTVDKVDRRVVRFLSALHLEEPGQADGALDQILVGRLVGVGPALAVAEGAHVDDARVGFAQVLVRELKPGHRRRADVVDQHVRVARQRKHRIARLGTLEVQRNRALVAVHVHEHVAHAGIAVGPQLARDIALGRLDLDDLRTQVTEDLRRIRPHQHRGQVEDAHALQRPAHREPLMPVPAPRPAPPA